MKIKNYTILFICLFISNLILAQKEGQKHFELIWKDNVSFELSPTESIKTCIIENNLLNDALIPEFSESWKVIGDENLMRYNIDNVQYEIFSPSSNILKADVNKELEVNFNFAKQREKVFAHLQLIPIIKEGATYKRVVSFDLNYKTNNLQLKSNKTSSLKNSVLSTGNWYKFAVDTTGVFKLDRSFLQSLGISTSSINPKNIKIYGNGGEMLPYGNDEFRQDGLQENAIFVNGEEDGSFDSGDYILFYAKGPHSWKSGGNSLNSYNHQYNIYSEESYYFITIGNDEGKRIPLGIQPSEIATTEIAEFHDFVFYEKDEVNLFSVGQQWFGESFSINNIQNFTIPFKNLNSSENVIVRVRAVAESSLTSQLNVKVGNQDLFTINFSAISGLTHAFAVERNGSIPLTGNSVNIQLEYNNNGNPSAKSYLDYIEVLGMKNLLADGKQFSFRNFNAANANSSEVVEYSITNSNQIFGVWDVTDYLEPKIIESDSDTGNFKFKENGGVLKEYIVLHEDDFFMPTKLDVSIVENQNLHNLSNIDYLVVTKEYLTSQAQRLADFHTDNSGFNTQVITLNKIYNEFSSGAKDITAIRDFVKHLYDHSTSNKIKYVCFLGDATFDYKDRLTGNNNIVPVFEAFNSFNLATSYVTDDFYGMMDSNEGRLYSYEKQDVATGRIPVTDILDAEKVIDKVLDYYKVDTYGQWRTNISLIADDIDAEGEEVLQLNMENIADQILLNKPLFNVKKIYLDAYKQESTAGGSSYPTVNAEIANQIDKGTLMIDYFGHGGQGGWASEGILTVEDIQNWKNIDKLPLFVTVTCEFSRFDNPLRESAGEFVFWNENGGAASLITTTREVYISVGQSINQELVKPLLEFENEDFSIAENLMNVKNKFSTTQRYFIYYIGDPAMKLAVPKPNVVLTKMNDVDISQSLDTIKALSRIKFEGEVLNEDNVLINDFNGEFSATIYDKVNVKSTLGQNPWNIKMDFDVQESKIFNGRATVENGIFTFDFVAPKDIKIAYGAGKLSLYAHNQKIDKSGYNLDVIVGGINEDAPEDNIGPTVQLYMNDLSFVDGGNTNQSPLFLAVLEDENGINTSITSVDHDIVIVIDGDESNSIVLNDYYETELDDFTKGKVSYQLRELEPGFHTINLKAWDTYNNLSEATLTFFVVGDGDMELSNVLNYPNPFVNYTEFWFNHNKPNELLEVQIQIFTISGKLVKTINQTVQSEGNLSRSISWNGLDDFGSRIGKGTYVYKLKVKSMNSNSSAEKIEKLVILQ